MSEGEALPAPCGSAASLVFAAVSLHSTTALSVGYHEIDGKTEEERIFPEGTKRCLNW